jgi:anti-sigma factor ChrR (cupin superfamily)
MDTLHIHADRKLPALVDGASLPWIPSPESGVDRRMLERSGGEIAIASTIVRYRAGSRFPMHSHALGEEFLVLSGTFSDAQGDYPAGSYVRNPPGSAHAPFSDEGCIIFVKLRQMNADEDEVVRMLPEQRTWQAGQVAGYDVVTLYDNGRTCVTLERLHRGAALPARAVNGGEEIFVLEGNVQAGDKQMQSLGMWTWSRRPGAKQPELCTDTGALLWVKRGHLK